MSAPFGQTSVSHSGCTIKPGPTADQMIERLSTELTAAGYRMQGTFNEVGGDNKIEVNERIRLIK